MGHIARFVVPGVPHLLTKRGNRRERLFFGDDDFELYKHRLAEQGHKHDLACWAYCLMPNHVHLILVPDSAAAERA